MSRWFPARHPHPDPSAGSGQALPPARRKGLFGRLTSPLAKKRVAGAVIGLALLALFLAFNRFPKLDTVREDLEVVNAPVVECFQGFCIETEPDTPFVQRWWDFSVEYIRLVAVGMTFAFLMAGLTEAFLFPRSEREPLSGGVWKRTLRGLAVGPVMTLCSACIAPVAASLWRRGAGVAGAIATVQGSATLNVPALVMVALVFSPMLGGSRVVVSLVAALLIGPLVALVVREHDRHGEDPSQHLDAEPDERASWAEVLRDGLTDWARLSAGYAVRLAPIMAAAAFASGLVIQWISPDTVSNYLGNDVAGVAVAATLGVLINVPLLFEIPLVALLLLLGMGEAPAAALLFTAAAGGPATFWALARFVPRRAIAAFASATWAFGIVVGVAVLGVTALYPQLQGGLRQPDDAPPVEVVRTVGADRLGVESSTSARSAPRVSSPQPPLAAFRPVPLDLPAVGAGVVVVFDYDNDGDNDIYAAAPPGWEARLLRNDGAGRFTDAAADAGLAIGVGGTAAAACDLDNDGYRDIYVGGASNPGTDRLFHNNGDGTFADATNVAFGDAANAREATSVACADVDGDGWLDLFVGNSPAQAGPGGGFLPSLHNALYLNNGDLTFDEVAEDAGVRGGQIITRDLDRQPVSIDAAEPIGQTTVALFFDHDDDGDPDLWVASDGDRLRVYRNDSSPGEPSFTPVARALGADRVGTWTDLAVGDFDGDADLDVLVVNAGLASLAAPPPDQPDGGCAYHARFSLGTCHHMLLRNDGEIGGAPRFVDVAGALNITGTQGVIESVGVHPFWPSPTGLSALPLGLGAAFLDVENDSDQDFFWSAAGPAANGQSGGAWQVLRGAGHAFETPDARAPGDVGRALALADLDGDGYADVVAAGDGGGGTALLNGGGGNNWLRLRLVGRTALGESGSNADGVGARVYVVTRPDADAPPVVQVRDVRAGSGLGSNAGLGLDFGLSEATSAITVQVFWPSGRVQRLSGVPANQALEIVEPPSE